MDKVQDIDELQKASDYRLVHKNLRWPAIGSIVFGLIAIGTGLASIQDNPINVVLALIGAFLFIEGIWLIVTPRPKGMFVDGIALCILGIWNILVTLGASGSTFFAVLGIFQIIWGFQSFGRYRRFSATPSQKPSEQSLKQVDEIVKSVIEAKRSESDDIIQFKTRGGFTGKVWKGKLAGDVGIFASTTGDDALFGRRDDVHFISKGKVPLGKTSKVTIQIGQRSFGAWISPESMQRYESWKGASR